MLKLIFISMVSIFLISCGGGGSSSSTPIKKVDENTDTNKSKEDIVSKKLIRKNYTAKPSHILPKDRDMISSSNYNLITNSDVNTSTGLTTIKFVNDSFSSNAKIYLYNISTKKVYSTQANVNGGILPQYVKTTIYKI